jgi:hypothetical protein
MPTLTVGMVRDAIGLLEAGQSGMGDTPTPLAPP